MKKLYDWVLQFAAHKHAPFYLFTVAFLESSIFPIPPDILLIPMVLVRFERAFYYAFLATLGSVLGGIFGYFLGYVFYETIGVSILNFYHMQEKFALLQQYYAEYDALIVGAAGFSPIPYKIFTILTGMMHGNLITFITVSIFSRGARFFLVSWLLWRGGVRLKDWIERNFYPLTMIGTVILVLLFVLIKFVMVRGA